MADDKKDKGADSKESYLECLLGSLKKQLRDVKFFIEIGAVSAALVYAVITFCMWRDSHNNFAIDERAWVKVNSKAMEKETIKEGGSIKGTVTISNTGKTTAKQFVSEFVILIVATAQTAPFDYTVPHTIETIPILQPNESEPALVSSNGLNPPTLTKSQADDLLNGRAYELIYGHGSYFDIFGEKHWFRYCGWQVYYEAMGAYNAGGCSAYNDNGDGELPPQN